MTKNLNVRGKKVNTEFFLENLKKDAQKWRNDKILELFSNKNLTDFERYALNFFIDQEMKNEIKN